MKNISSNSSSIVEQVPVSYYQNGVKNNLLQRIWHTSKVKHVLDYIPDSPKKILDVGCASGWFITQISKEFPRAKYFGVDIYEQGIIHAKKLYKKIEFKVADAHKIPFKDMTFDLVLCTEVLEHVDNPEKVLLEIKRVLRPNGKAIIELDSGSIIFSVVWHIWGKFGGKVWTDAHIHSFSVQKLEQIILECKFQIKKKKRFNLGMAMIFLIEKI